MEKIDQLIFDVNFTTGSQQAAAQAEIWNLAQAQGAYSASINDVYLARGAEKLPHTFTVPAMNLRGLAYHTAQAAFRAAQKLNVGLMIFELARSEMGYTAQPPSVYASNILAAAVKTGWNKPIFIQGDHFQTKAKAPGQAKEGEVEAVKKLISQAIKAGFYNIDLDASTLVDLSPTDEYEQQRANYEVAAELASLVRSLQPAGVTISIGGEIGEVGKHNSKPEELMAYMKGFQERYHNPVGLSKISIQTGTSHGGVVNADGSLAEVAVDFDTILTMSKMAREQYGMGGAVQHGASTLPREMFDKFPEHQTLEIHLATGFQNLIMDHPAFPQELLQKMYAWCDQNCQDEREADHTDQQFYYKARKKAWGPFKQETWTMPESALEQIMGSLETEFGFYFKELNVVETNQIVTEWIKPVKIEKTAADYREDDTISASQVAGLAD